MEKCPKVLTLTHYPRTLYPLQRTQLSFSTPRWELEGQQQALLSLAF
ncbi:hypothetical protein OROHE_018442 [Orobanche hederae]